MSGTRPCHTVRMPSIGIHTTSCGHIGRVSLTTLTLRIVETSPIVQIGTLQQGSLLEIQMKNRSETMPSLEDHVKVKAIRLVGEMDKDVTPMVVR